MNKTKEFKRQIAGQTNQQLREMLLGLKKELFNLRFRKSYEGLKDSSSFCIVRKNIARINTELTKIKRGT